MKSSDFSGPFSQFCLRPEIIDHLCLDVRVNIHALQAPDLGQASAKLEGGGEKYDFWTEKSPKNISSLLRSDNQLYFSNVQDHLVVALTYLDGVQLMTG